MTGWLSIQDSNAFIAAKQAEGLTGEEIGVAWHDFLEARAEALKPLWEAKRRNGLHTQPRSPQRSRSRKPKKPSTRNGATNAATPAPTTKAKSSKPPSNGSEHPNNTTPTSTPRSSKELRRAAHALAVEDDELRWGDDA